MKYWIHAARLRTLPLSMSGIILGSFIAKWRLNLDGNTWDWKIFALAMLVTLLYQILSNFANDYGDGIRGTDEKRVGELRAVAAGHITAAQMKIGVIVLAILSLAATIALLYRAFLPDHLNSFYLFIALGIACILAAIGYTVGKNPYGYYGLGDIFVFVFFGLVSVCGSYFLFTKSFSWDILLPATSVGLFSTAVLNLNNMRDIESDFASGKHTFALKLGFKHAMVYEIILLQLPLIIMLAFMFINKLHETNHYYAFLFFILMLPLMAIRRKIMEVKEPHELDQFLKQVGIMCFAMSVMVAIGLNYFN